MEDPIAAAHRRVAEGEHGVEKHLKSIADQLGDPEGAVARAGEISAAADEHLAKADEIEAQSD